MADRGILVIGNRRYSSWSLRGWLLVRLAGLDPVEQLIPLGIAPGAIGDASPSGQVPYLRHDGNQVWESLAIAEYCAELAPSLWPADRPSRTRARVLSAEMHAGYRALRMSMPMNLGRGRSLHDGIPANVQADISRIEQVWTEALAVSGGPFLFGATFGAADAMFAPVVARLLGYRVQTGEAASEYCTAVVRHELVRAWYEAAMAEPDDWLLHRYESVA